MRQDLDDELCRDFPNLYRDRRADMRETAMCWGFPGDGWHGLIRRLSEKLEGAILTLPPGQREHCRASQVKAKFGTLRFYMTCTTPEMDAWIAGAMQESAKTCESCGAPGRLRDCVVSCEDCERKHRDEMRRLSAELRAKTKKK